MIIAVDFDGTCVTNEFPNIGKDIGAIPVLKALVKAGHKLILYTIRDNKTVKTNNNTFRRYNYLDEAINWFNENKIPLYGINENPEQTFSNSRKVYADLYIDDTALTDYIKYDSNNKKYIDWEKVESYLVNNSIINKITRGYLYILEHSSIQIYEHQITGEEIDMETSDILRKLNMDLDMCDVIYSEIKLPLNKI